MAERAFIHLGSFRDVRQFRSYLTEQQIDLPCDEELLSGDESPLSQPLHCHNLVIGNRFAIHPMEGWDGTTDGRPSERTLHRWRYFGMSGAKLIWGGEAVAVTHEGRANPNQLLLNDKTRDGIARLRDALLEEHKLTIGSTKDLMIGLQLTHSGRYSKPNDHSRPEPRILYRHPILDRRLGLAPDYPVITDGEIREIINAFHRAALMASELGFDFVDIKHCHGYLGHEFLSAHTREGDYGGSFENRTRFLREIVAGIRALAPRLEIGVRLSAFDVVPFQPSLQASAQGKPGAGIPEAYENLLPYRWGFGINQNNPTEPDLTETVSFLALLRELGVRLVNLTAGSPYYNPHLQRPALYPPSDGYAPPHDPLIEIARQFQAARTLKKQFADLHIIGTGYTYLQDFLPYVAQAAVREGWVDSVGLGRMVLSYPQLPADVLAGRSLQHRRICRTFSDCTTAPRNGLPSGCYPLDSYYKSSPEGVQLKQIKNQLRKTNQS